MKEFENFYAPATLLRTGQERSKMGSDDMGKGAREDETGMGSGKGKGDSEGLWWHVGALAAAVRSALRPSAHTVTKAPSLAPGTQSRVNRLPIQKVQYAILRYYNSKAQCFTIFLMDEEKDLSHTALDAVHFRLGEFPS
jgi:hypothetical protein